MSISSLICGWSAAEMGRTSGRRVPKTGEFLPIPAERLIAGRADAI
jgi:hypothetical protein